MRAISFVSSSEASEITTGTTGYPPSRSGIDWITNPTFWASLYAGMTTTIRSPEGSRACWFQSKDWTARASTR